MQHTHTTHTQPIHFHLCLENDQNPCFQHRQNQHLCFEIFIQTTTHTNNPYTHTHTPSHTKHSLELRAVAAGKDAGGDGDDDGGDAVAEEVVPADPRALGLEDLDQHDVELDPLQTHPGKGGQEGEVQHARDDRTQHLPRVHTGRAQTPGTGTYR